MPGRKPPSMQRSRSQLATIYAPQSLFTFEGGTGACIAKPCPNRAYDPSGATTKRTIHEQIVEYMESWLRRATNGRDTVVPVSAERALDPAALRNGAVYLPIGKLHFQVPERVGYLPFPTAFVCTRCDLHRSCSDETALAEEALRFRNSCPQGPEACADDWQQLDVVMAHWSGAVEALTPARRPVDQDNLSVETLSTCVTCRSERFFLRRAGSTFARWFFECVECRTPREIRLEDRDTLEELKRALVTGSNVLPQINMEPVSYRASAAYYPQGDRLLVFSDDTWLSLLLQTANRAALERFIVAEFGFPPPSLDDAERERLLRAAGRGKEWDGFVGLRRLVGSMRSDPDSADAVALMEQQMREREAVWNTTVFSARASAPGSIASVLDERQTYVRRFDPIRMAVEHKTLLEESLRSGAVLPDGKQTAVDVILPDDFMVPDAAADPDARRRLSAEVARRLGLLGLAELRLVRGVKICEYTFGYTRTSSTPLVTRDKAGTAEMPVRLNLLGRVKVGEEVLHPVLCLEQSNEAFYVRLQEATVLEWLARNGVQQQESGGTPRMGGRLIEEYRRQPFTRFLDEYRRERSTSRSAYTLVYTLLHTMAHQLIDVSASMSGLDLGSFGEHLFIPDLAFLVYRRGVTMDLGNLSSMWRDRGDLNCGNEVLERMVSPESLRCGSESVCTHHGGACPDCVLIPETACLTRNELLSRSVLTGRGLLRWDADRRDLVGFYRVAQELAVTPSAPA
ncbi:MAG TPA: hypothetical protein VHO06_21455 [Polyangia bacterium]|nr:hypothetical protein [Polyangia bacterium]